jgi:hypothetical protein
MTTITRKIKFRLIQVGYSLGTIRVYSTFSFRNFEIIIYGKFVDDEGFIRGWELSSKSGVYISSADIDYDPF